MSKPREKAGIVQVTPEATGSMDPVLLFTILSLVAFGIVMVYSSSAVFAQVKTGDSLYFLKRQIIIRIDAINTTITFMNIQLNNTCSK